MAFPFVKMLEKHEVVPIHFSSPGRSPGRAIVLPLALALAWAWESASALAKC